MNKEIRISEHSNRRGSIKTPKSNRIIDALRSSKLNIPKHHDINKNVNYGNRSSIDHNPTPKIQASSSTIQHQNTPHTYSKPRPMNFISNLKFQDPNTRYSNSRGFTPSYSSKLKESSKVRLAPSYQNTCLKPLLCNASCNNGEKRRDISAYQSHSKKSKNEQAGDKVFGIYQKLKSKCSID